MVSHGSSDVTLEDILRQLGKIDREVLRSYIQLHSAIDNATSGISAIEAELIILTTSLLNSCSYCIDVHSIQLQELLESKGRTGLISQLGEDLHRADLSIREKDILDFVEKLNNDTGGVTIDDIRAMSDRGFDIATILKITLLCAEFNFANRVSSVLGQVIEHRLL